MTMGGKPRVSGRQATFREAMLEGLSLPQKQIPPRYLYDELGSALFEAITFLPEYYPTGRERFILDRYGIDIAKAAGRNLDVVELGSGSSAKTRILLEAILERQPHVRYIPIDISAGALRASVATLESAYAEVEVLPVEAEYVAGLEALPDPIGARLFLFMGSNIGNFSESDALDMLLALSRRMEGDDRLLVGIDLPKSPDVIERAYNDPLGVTAAFNKNLLVRANRELGAKFDLRLFEHHAPYLPDEGKIEMHLVSLADQEVPVAGRTFGFRKGESIHTEDSRKIDLEQFGALAMAARLAPKRVWTDYDGWFGVVLLGKA